MNANDYARKRCEKLLCLANEVLDSKPERAKKYVVLARKIGEVHRLKLGGKSFCRKCSVPWVQGKTLKVRLDSSKKTVLYICLCCNYVRRIPYSRKRSLR